MEIEMKGKRGKEKIAGLMESHGGYTVAQYSFSQEIFRLSKN